MDMRWGVFFYYNMSKSNCRQTITQPIQLIIVDYGTDINHQFLVIFYIEFDLCNKYKSSEVFTGITLTIKSSTYGYAWRAISNKPRSSLRWNQSVLVGETPSDIIIQEYIVSAYINSMLITSYLVCLISYASRLLKVYELKIIRYFIAWICNIWCCTFRSH